MGEVGSPSGWSEADAKSSLLQREEALRQRMRHLFDEYEATEQELRQLEADRFRVCIFGSARIGQQDPTYRMVRKVARALGTLGIDVVTGGGPGLMDAANRGIKDVHQAGIQSIGLLISLPKLREPANKHLDIKSEHHRFSTRLDEFLRLSHAVIVAPGGIGTMLELLYVWQVMQVHLAECRPLILLGEEYWSGLLGWMKSHPLDREFVSPGDFDMIHFADTPAQVLELITPSLEQFRNRKRAAGQHPEADAAELMMSRAEEVKQEPAHQEPLPGTSSAAERSGRLD